MCGSKGDGARQGGGACEKAPGKSEKWRVSLRGRSFSGGDWWDRFFSASLISDKVVNRRNFN